MTRRLALQLIALSLLTLLLFAVDLSAGAVGVPFGDVISTLFGDAPDAATAKIVIDIRLVKAFVALLAGAALAVSGLEMQTLFRNPLAGPYVLGVSSGASLGVALFVLLPVGAIGAASGAFQSLGMAGAAFAGSVLVLAVVAAVGRRVKDIMVVLILGMMFASGVSAIVQVLQYLSRDEALKAFVIWTMGSLGDVTRLQAWVLLGCVILGFGFGIASIKSLNLLLLGEEYARTMGLRSGRTRSMLFFSTSLLAGGVTAFCGPIGFIGLALPHVARWITGSPDHRLLLPMTALVGASTLLLCDIISKALLLPINAITALLGIPIVIWIVMRLRYKE